MKLLPYVYLLFIINFSPAVAQTRKTDDALLLDYYQNQRFADALTYLKNVYTEPVTNLTELSRLAYTSAMAGKLPQAEDFYQRIYDKDTSNQSALYSLAGINTRRGNAVKAEVYYKKFTLKDSTNFLVYKQLAKINSDKVNITGQIYYLQKANQINPTEADVASDLSDRYVQLKQLAQAEKILQVAIAADAENIMLQQSLLKLNYAESKWPETLKTGEQLVLLGDSSTATISKLGRAYYQTKNYSCGIAILTALPDMSQNETTAYFTAVCYKQLKDQKNAIAYFKKAILLSISPNSGTYYNEMADSYQTLKQYKSAKEAYQKSLLYEDKALTYYFLADLYDTELKDKKNALKYFRKYIAAKPDEKQQTYIAYAKSRIDELSKKQ